MELNIPLKGIKEKPCKQEINTEGGFDLGLTFVYFARLFTAL